MVRKITYLSLFCAVLFTLNLKANALSETNQFTNSRAYVEQAWIAQNKGDYALALNLTDSCINQYSAAANELAKTLSAFPLQNQNNQYQTMNDVAVAHFIKAETLRDTGDFNNAKITLNAVIAQYPYSREFDQSRGTYWSIKETAQQMLREIEGLLAEEDNQIEPEIKINLFDPGKEFPLDYKKYGSFSGIGSNDYKYTLEDQAGLTEAAGEGVYPNTKSVRNNSRYKELKNIIFKTKHWEILNSRNFELAFFSWCFAPEPPGVRQFYIADVLERSGLITQALKAYYAVIIHFPKTYGWTYWHTPWYPAKTALYRIKNILATNPELNLRLQDAELTVLNSTDNDVKNDVYIINPGKFVKGAPQTKAKLQPGKPIKIIPNPKAKIKLVKYASGDWQLLVNDTPFIIKGITYSPTRVGESPDKQTIINWMTQDLNFNQLSDGPYDAWVDLNKNNVQDENETVSGDFKLLKEMGINCLRLYHQPFSLDNKLLRQLYQDYGIYCAIGDFIGKYTLGSNAGWDKGTDYDDLKQQQIMLESVKNMVLAHRNEPYVLLWILGNENVYGVGCNADKKPKSFFKFANTAARLIKSLDPLKRPVAIASGDTLYLDLFAQNCPDIDIFGTNAYRGKYGFLDLWDEVKRIVDKPVLLSEYGAPAYAKGYSETDAQDFQAAYHKAAWLDIKANFFGYGTGNALGGFIFEWLDEWWKSYTPFYHDRKGLFTGPFLDGYMHEEWLGLASQGNGCASPYLRQLRKAYYMYQKLWQN